MNEIKKKRVLVVDDEVDLVELLESRLQESDYDVIKAYDGQEGLQKVESEKPDLMLLDLALPKIDGYELCRLLKKDERYSRLPIILFSARAREEDVRRGKVAGADDYITKPFQAEVLLDKISKLIKLTEGPLLENDKEAIP